MTKYEYIHSAIDLEPRDTLEARMVAKQEAMELRGWIFEGSHANTDLRAIILIFKKPRYGPTIIS
jgi:hypothetical protein